MDIALAYQELVVDMMSEVCCHVSWWNQGNNNPFEDTINAIIELVDIPHHLINHATMTSSKRL